MVCSGIFWRCQSPVMCTCMHNARFCVCLQPRTSLSPGECSRINTGAAIPAGADAVVQVEDTKLLESTADGKEELSVDILTRPRPGLDIRYICRPSGPSVP